MSKKQKLNATELGALWMTFQKKTLILRMLEYFIVTVEDKEAKQQMTALIKKLSPKVQEIRDILEAEGTAVPLGMTNADVNLKAAKLFNNNFEIMFSRILKQISMGMYTLHLTMSYRSDIIKLYEELTAITQTSYRHFTEYLIAKGAIATPAYIEMPKSIDFITDKSYLKGTNLFGKKRILSTIEFAYLYHAIETNSTGLDLLLGFAQTTQNAEVKAYFNKGIKISKNIMSSMREILLEQNIQASATAKGTVTLSKDPPFSDKLMMHCNYFLCNFSLGSQSFGAGFSLRNDINLKFAIFAEEIIRYSREGVDLMIKHGWFEQPPHMNDHS